MASAVDLQQQLSNACRSLGDKVRELEAVQRSPQLYLVDTLAEEINKIDIMRETELVRIQRERDEDIERINRERDAQIDRTVAYYNALIGEIKQYEAECMAAMRKLNDDALLLTESVDTAKTFLNEYEALLAATSAVDAKRCAQAIAEAGVNQRRIEKQLNELQAVIRMNMLCKFKETTKSEEGIRGVLHLFPQCRSHILTEHQWTQLLDLCDFGIGTNFKLLWRGSRDGFTPHDFYTNCSDAEPTLMIVKARDTEFIFGGYTTVPWHLSTRDHPHHGYATDKHAFLFSLVNKDRVPVKMRCIEPQYAVMHADVDSTVGPVFGQGDLIILDKWGQCCLGCSYDLPRYEHSDEDETAEEAEGFLAGNKEFIILNIEVFQIV